MYIKIKICYSTYDAVEVGLMIFSTDMEKKNSKIFYFSDLALSER